MNITKRKKSKFSFFIIIVLLFILVWGCSSTSKIHKNEEVLPTYKVEESLDFKDVPEPYKYVFLRLYDVDYLNPFYIANVLKFGITSTEVTDITASHVAINFSLTDDFYGLTSGGEYKLTRESCTDTKANKFMKKCDPETSTQITYALKVPENEYYKIKEYVEKCSQNKDIKYKTSIIFSISSFATKRKFFTKKDHQQFGTVKYPKIEVHDDPNYEETEFVCSTFVAYALMKNISEVGEWFKENEINFQYVAVTDIPLIPGVSTLFSSKFNEYDIAAEEFVAKFPEFAPYYYDVYENGVNESIDLAS